MERLKTSARAWIGVQEQRWNCLPLKKQRRFIRLLFLAYALLTVLVLLFEFSDKAASDQEIKVDHIHAPNVPGSKNPAALEDTVSIIIKNKIYERI